jgi:hypothetical protein
VETNRGPQTSPVARCLSDPAVAQRERPHRPFTPFTVARPILTKVTMQKLLLVFPLLALAAPRVDAAISVVETQEVHTASATSSLATNAFSANPATGDLIVCLVSTVKFSGEAPAHNACTDTAANADT